MGRTAARTSWPRWRGRSSRSSRWRSTCRCQTRSRHTSTTTSSARAPPAFSSSRCTGPATFPHSKCSGTHKLAEFRSTKINLRQFCSVDNQVELVRHTWPELFTLGLAQSSDTLSVQSILCTVLSNLQASQDRLSPQRVKEVYINTRFLKKLCSVFVTSH